jgi:hypothetical protein
VQVPLGSTYSARPASPRRAAVRILPKPILFAGWTMVTLCEVVMGDPQRTTRAARKPSTPSPVTAVPMSCTNVYSRRPW